MQIYVGREGDQRGPYTLEQVQQYLAQGRLQFTDSAWYEGLDNWIPLSEVPGIIVAQSEAPPFSRKESTPQRRRIEQHLQQPRQKIFPVACMVIGLGALVAALFIFQGSQSEPEEDASVQKERAEGIFSPEAPRKVAVNRRPAKVQVVCMVIGIGALVAALFIFQSSSNEDALSNIPGNPGIVGLWETKDENVRVHIKADGTFTVGYVTDIRRKNAGIVYARGTWGEKDGDWQSLFIETNGNGFGEVMTIAFIGENRVFSYLQGFMAKGSPGGEGYFRKHGIVFSLPFKNRLHMLSPIGEGVLFGYRSLERLE